MTEESGYDVEVYTVTRREIEEIVGKAVERSVKTVMQEEFAGIGLPISTAAERLSAADRLRSLERWQKALDGAASTVGRTIIATAVVSGSGLIGWLLLRFVVKQ